MTHPTPDSDGSATHCLRSTPVVCTQSVVAWDTFESKRTRYPTSSPSRHPRILAICPAMALVANRRGWTKTRLSPGLSPSWTALGTSNVFPEPGGAPTTTGPDSAALRMSWSTEATGKLLRNSTSSVHLFMVSKSFDFESADGDEEFAITSV